MLHPVKGKVELRSWQKNQGDPSIKYGVCAGCTGRVLRSWRTGILHKYCHACRYFRMIYGPSITVRRVD